MRNYEKYAEEMRKYDGKSFCDDFIIPHIFNSKDNCMNIDCKACHMLQTIWLFEEYEEPKEPEVDWSKVAVDTLILVRDTEYDEWEKGHFAKYENGKICVWCGGQTSWTAEGAIAEWKYAKLAENEEGGAK